MNAVAETAPAQGLAEPRKDKPLGVQLKDREAQFHAALPAHMPVERFMRVVLTAVQNQPGLLKADRASLWNSCMRAAQDGLLPDGRDGALVIYKTKDGDRWIDKVQWMPMVGGIRKKVRNSGEIRDWNCQVVHAKDAFEFELGDAPFIKHKPYLGDGDPGPVIAAYSIAQFKSGELSREVMTRAQIDKVRSVSRSKDKGPWVDWFPEMCRKTVARRHAKVLPMSSDLDDLIRRDDALYDLDGKSDKQLAAPPRNLGDRLDMLAGTKPVELIEAHDADTGEITPSGADPETADAPVQAAVKGAEASPTVSAPESRQDLAKPAPAKAAAPENPPAASDEKRAAAEARRKALLADLTRQGDEAAEGGARNLDRWLDGLTGDETALIAPDRLKAWRHQAARANA